ncbi:mediator complex subunit Med15, partial [Halocaridina rubra]
VFQKSSKRDDYMQYIARVVMHLRDLGQNNNQQNNNPHLQAVLTAPGPNTQITGNVSQMVGPGGPMQGPGGQMGGPSGSVVAGPNQMVATSGPIVAGPNQAILSGQQTMPGTARMGQPMPPSLPNQSGEITSWGGNNRRIEMQLSGIKKQQNNTAITLSQIGQQNKMSNIQMAIPGQTGPIPQMTQLPNQIVPGVGRGAGSMQPRVPSPVMRQGTPSSTSASPAPPLSAPNSQASPAFISPSPSSNMVPSPAGGSTGNMMRGASHIGAPSPSSMINTPGQPQQPSPVNQCLGNSQGEDVAYREKVRQLSKYIVPLRRVIERIGNEDVEKSRKMKQLLDMLQNPQRRMPMDTLLKCEQVLVKLEIRDDTGPSAPPSMESRIATLNEAVNNVSKSLSGAHTLHRTFAPALSVLLGPTYTSNPTKRFKRDNPLQPLPETPNISDVVQGEVARLNSRFRVNLDCQQPPGSDDLTLICQLDDPSLPCVPPITLTIPSTYPLKTPKCDLLPVDYETTDFLKSTRESMLVRLQNMPPHCSLTMILHCWEMSVRQACSPKASLTSIIANSITLT